MVNSNFNQGETIEESKIFRKILKSSPERFHPKVTAFEESKDVDTIKEMELVGFQQNYELTQLESYKNKFMALKTINKEDLDFSDD